MDVKLEATKRQEEANDFEQQASLIMTTLYALCSNHDGGVLHASRCVPPAHVLGVGLEVWPWVKFLS